jgi:hypothetical protein
MHLVGAPVVSPLKVEKKSRNWQLLPLLRAEKNQDCDKKDCEEELRHQWMM